MMLTSGEVAGSVLLNASANRAVLAGPRDCREAFNDPARRASTTSGVGAGRWASGFGMFNTIQPPNDTFGGCRFDDRLDGWPDRA